MAKLIVDEDEGKDSVKKGIKNKSKWSEGVVQPRSSGGGSSMYRILKIVTGEKYIVRLTEDNYEHGWIHWIEGVDKDGNLAKRKVVCLGKEKCPVCQVMKLSPEDTVKWKAKHVYFMNIIDRGHQKENGKTRVHLLQCGSMLYNDIAAIIEKYGLPTTYDMEIKRTGIEWKDTKYKAMLDEKYPLTEKELKRIAKTPEEGGNYNLLDQVARKDVDEILLCMRKRHRNLLKDTIGSVKEDTDEDEKNTKDDED